MLSMGLGAHTFGMFGVQATFYQLGAEKNYETCHTSRDVRKRKYESPCCLLRCVLKATRLECTSNCPLQSGCLMCSCTAPKNNFFSFFISFLFFFFFLQDKRTFKHVCRNGDISNMFAMGTAMEWTETSYNGNIFVIMLETEQIVLHRQKIVWLG